MSRQPAVIDTAAVSLPGPSANWWRSQNSGSSESQACQYGSVAPAESRSRPPSGSWPAQLPERAGSQRLPDQGARLFLPRHLIDPLEHRLQPERAAGLDQLPRAGAADLHCHGRVIRQAESGKGSAGIQVGIGLIIILIFDVLVVGTNGNAWSGYRLSEVADARVAGNGTTTTAQDE